MIRTLSLYTGIGGFEVAREQVLEETKVVCYVEKEPYCQEVLQARIKDGLLDDAPIWDDVFTLPCEQLAGVVDLITAGFPCQPFSFAGKRKGKADERNLWPITAKAIGKIRPPFVLLENVPGLASPSDGQPPYALTVLGDLAEMGYDAVWGIVGARDAGASHRRSRWWCLAYSQGIGDSLPWKMGNELIHHGCSLGYTYLSQGLQNRRAESTRELPSWPPGPQDTDAWGAVLEKWPELAPALAFASDRKARQTGKLSQSIHAYREETQSSVRGVAHGIQNRVDRLKALGNAIVPLQGALALKMLLERLP